MTRTWTRCAVGLLISAMSSLTLASPDSLCHADESVKYNCLTGKKTASLCASPASGAPEALTYRFGTAGKIELEFVASSANGQAFSAFTLPVHPRAQIHQLWFDRGNTRYLMTECVGGNCVADGRIGVFVGDKLVLNAQCRNPLTSPPSFARDLVQFGPRQEDARALSPLVKWEAEANAVETMYKAEAGQRVN